MGGTLQSRVLCHALIQGWLLQVTQRKTLILTEHQASGSPAVSARFLRQDVPIGMVGLQRPDLLNRSPPESEVP